MIILMKSILQQLRCDELPVRDTQITYFRSPVNNKMPANLGLLQRVTLAASRFDLGTVADRIASAAIAHKAKGPVLAV